MLAAFWVWCLTGRHGVSVSQAKCRYVVLEQCYSRLARVMSATNATQI
jgi:hypothetical protein